MNHSVIACVAYDYERNAVHKRGFRSSSNNINNNSNNNNDDNINEKKKQIKNPYIINGGTVLYS